MSVPFFVVFCDQHKYIFSYKPGREDELISQMIDYAMDCRHPFGWAEVRSILKHFGVASAEAPPKPPTS